MKYKVKNIQNIISNQNGDYTVIADVLAYENEDLAYGYECRALKLTADEMQELNILGYFYSDREVIQHLTYHERVDAVGRIMLPVEYRRSLGLQNKQKIKLEIKVIDGEEKIVISKE